MMDMIKEINKQRLAVIIAAAVGIISTFLPWLTVDALFMRIHASGIDGWRGWLVILVLAGAIAIALLGDRKKVIDLSDDKFKWGLVATGGITAIVALFFFINVAGTPLTSIGIGVFLAIIAGAAVAAVPFLDPKIFDVIPIGVNASTIEDPTEDSSEDDNNLSE